MALNLNDFKITPRKGLYAYMPNVPQPHNCIAGETLVAGDIVKLDSTATNANCPVLKKASVTDKVFGVVPADAMKNAYAVNDKVPVAVTGSTIFMPVAGAVTQGAVLYFTADGEVTATVTAGNTILGVAQVAAAAKGDLVQVKLA